MHPGTKALLDAFAFYELDDDGKAWVKAIRSDFACIANDIVEVCGEGPETTAALRKLMESKDCAIRAIVAKHKKAT